ncbi:hypothetical protein [Curtobacterium sp. 1544]|uniref:hypothetical protein n=1 Tax=Curtobacterium sp. 1544 TaxID=3156417 RepID=UPI003396C81B
MDDLSRSSFAWLLVHLATIVQAQPRGTFVVDRIVNEHSAAELALASGKSARIPLVSIDERSLPELTRAVQTVDSSISAPMPGAVAIAREFGDEWDGWASALLDFGGYEWAFREPNDRLRYVLIERDEHHFRVTADLGTGPGFSRLYPLALDGQIEEFQARDFGFDAAAALKL